MKFSADMDIALYYTQKYIVTMDINICGFYGIIVAMFCQDSYIF